MIKYLTMTIGVKKNIALIAHDGKKQEMLKWCADNKEILQKHNLCGTGTTARMITDQVGLTVKGYNSGPLGGDQQIGARIVEGSIDMVIFFSDPLLHSHMIRMSKLCSVSPRSTISRWPIIRPLRISCCTPR